MQRRTVNIALPLVGLRNEQIGNMPSDGIFVADGVTPEDLLQSAGHLSRFDQKSGRGYRLTLSRYTGRGHSSVA